VFAQILMSKKKTINVEYQPFIKARLCFPCIVLPWSTTLLSDVVLFLKYNFFVWYRTFLWSTTFSSDIVLFFEARLFRLISYFSLKHNFFVFNIVLFLLKHDFFVWCRTFLWSTTFSSYIVLISKHNFFFSSDKNIYNCLKNRFP